MPHFEMKCACAGESEMQLLLLFGGGGGGKTWKEAQGDQMAAASDLMYF